MADRTDFADFTHLDPSDALSADNYGIQHRNPLLIDYFLRLIWEGARDGHDAMADPADPATAAVDAAGGQIPSDLTLSVGYTLLDGDGGESALAPLTVVATPAGLAAPEDSPVVVRDTVAGTLLANTYAYAVTLTDGAGGETALGPPAVITIPGGSSSNEITVSGLTSLISDPQEWRLWRSVGGEEFHLIAQGTDDEVVDDGSLTADCGVAPPSVTGTTNSTSRLRVTVPSGQPAGAAQFRIYVAIDGDFDGPSLLGTYAIADLDAEKTYTELAFLGSSPPERSTAMPALPGSGGGGGGGLFGYPVDWSDTLTAADWTRLSALGALVLLRDPGNSLALLYEGNGEFDTPWPLTEVHSFNASDTVERRTDFFVAESAPGMRNGTVTVRFQFGAVDADFTGSVSAYIGHRLGMRTYARLLITGVDSYFLSVGVEEPSELTEEDAGYVDASAVALAADTDYWMSVTRDESTLSAALYDEDPVANPAAVPLAEVAPTLESTKAFDWTRRQNAMPGFGWKVLDAALRNELVRVYGVQAHVTSGGEGYSSPEMPRIKIEGYDPTTVLNFPNLTVTDERPDIDRITISVPGMRDVGSDNFGTLAAYTSQNMAVDNLDVQANLAGDDARAVNLTAPGFWDMLARALFFGVAADDQFGVMVKAVDIDTYLLGRVDNATAAPTLEIVSVDGASETVVASTAITQVINGSAANPWDVDDPVWLSLEYRGGFVVASLYGAHPNMESTAPVAQVGSRLTGAVNALHAVQAGYGLTLVPAAGGGNTLRGTDLAARTNDA